MSQVWNLYRREMASYFATPVAYVFIVIFLVASGYLTVSRDFGRFLELRQAALDPFFRVIPWLFVVLVPAVAMRLWSTRLPRFGSKIAMPRASRFARSSSAPTAMPARAMVSIRAGLPPVTPLAWLGC